MDTLTIILAMVAMAALLLAVAAFLDRYLQARRDQRRLQMENPELASKKPDAADAVIAALNRSGEALRKTVQTAKEDRK